jgi:hypothetical protein
VRRDAVPLPHRLHTSRSAGARFQLATEDVGAHIRGGDMQVCRAWSDSSECPAPWQSPIDKQGPLAESRRPHSDARCGRWVA